MSMRNEVVEVFRDVLSEHLGVPASDIELGQYLQSDLGIDEDDFEELASNLTQKLERPALTSDLFDEDITLEQAVAHFAS